MSCPARQKNDNRVVVMSNDRCRHWWRWDCEVSPKFAVNFEQAARGSSGVPPLLHYVSVGRGTVSPHRIASETSELASEVA